MALIYCPYCGARISDRARACPKCGHQIDLKSSISSATTHQPSLNQSNATASVETADAKRESTVIDVAGSGTNNVQNTSSDDQSSPQSTVTISESVAPPSVKISQSHSPIPPESPPRMRSAPTPSVFKNSLPTTSYRNGKIWLYVLVGFLLMAVIAYISTLSSSDNQPQNEPVSQSESPATEASEAEPVQVSNPNLIALGDLVNTFADNTWLRSSAVKGVDYNKLDLLPDGVSLQVQDVYGEWVRVRKQNDGKEGYVAADFVMPATLYAQLISRTTSTQRSNLKMAKYRRAVANHLACHKSARYRGLLSELSYSDGMTAILLLFTYPDGASENVLFSFYDTREIWKDYLTKPAVNNPRIHYDGYKFSIIEGY